MSERGGSGVGPFLLGIGLGVALGFLFAPEAGDITRRRLGRKVSRLKEVATDKVEELRDLAGEMLEGGDEDGDGEREAPPPTAREQLERKLAAQRRRRRELKAAAEADEPDA
jgi:gas vesicle protein